MREFKFRAWHKPNKIMLDLIAINFSLMQITADIENRKIYPELDYWWKETDIPFSEIVLMQSTGLFDKNGVEIYEGDIVREFANDYTPIYQNGIYMAYNVDKINEPHISTQFNVIWRNGCEVIGNIYENKDLIEVEWWERLNLEHGIKLIKK